MILKTTLYDFGIINTLGRGNYMMEWVIQDIGKSCLNRGEELILCAGKSYLP